MSEDKPIRIVRTPHSKDRPYFSMARSTAQDNDISYEALGLLTYLLSKPDGWEVNIKDVAKRSTKYKAYKMLRELRQAGYMKLEKEEGKGRYSQWVYQIFETCQLIEFQQVEFQVVENQHTQYVQSPEQSTEKSKSAGATSQPSKPTAVNGIPPSGNKKRSEKSTPLQMWLNRLPAVKSVVCALLTSCYEGWDSVMMSPENSLTVQQLEKYITNAEEYIRLGGSAGEVGQVYEFIGEVDYSIAPQTIAGFYLRWKASQKTDEPIAIKVVPESPKVVMTEVERAARLAQMKADKAVLFN